MISSNNLTAILIPAGLFFIGTMLLFIYLFFKKNLGIYLREKLDRIPDSHTGLILNAYERLALLCERIQPGPLAMRLQTSQLNAQALSQAMIVAIQQEFDHNITQQIYISEKLWNIILLSRDEAIYEIIQTAGELSPDTEGKTLTQKLMEQRQNSSLNKALQAIRKEAKLYVKV